MFFDPFFPYCLRILNDPEFNKGRPIDDIGRFFMRIEAQKKGEEAMLQIVFLLPDSPVIYELFFTALAAKLRASKRDIVKSLKDYSENLHKYGPLENITYQNYCAALENLHDEKDLYAIKQDPKGVIKLYLDLLRSKASILGLKEENLQVIQSNLEGRIPKFLINQLS